MTRTFFLRSFSSSLKVLRYQASPPLSCPPSFWAGDWWSKSLKILQSCGRSNFCHVDTSASDFTASLGFALSLKCQFWLKFTFLSSIIWFTSSFVAAFNSSLTGFSWLEAWDSTFGAVSSGFRDAFSSFGATGSSSFFSGLLASIGAAWLWSTLAASLCSATAWSSFSSTTGLSSFACSTVWVIGVSSAKTGGSPMTLPPNRTAQVPIMTEQAPTANLRML